MSDNRTFFKNAAKGQMTLKDIFSDVKRKHTPEESARVFIAGTALTTPSEAEMLAGWQKPFLFARFAVITLVCMLMCMVLSPFARGGSDPLLAGMALMVPMTMLLLAWEMNIPRTISLMEILKIVGLGGILSLIFTIGLSLAGINLSGAMGAPAVEEPAKLAVVYILLKRKNRKYILEGVLLGMAVGTGFAIVETFCYIMDSSREGMIDYISYCLSNNINPSYQEIMEYGYTAGIETAIMRAVNGVVGHGVYAAIYSGGLMIAKGAEPININHLTKPVFLKYFAASVLIHFLNNNGAIHAYFPDLLGGMITTWSFAKMALGGFFLLPLMRDGVNQVVKATTAHHGGRVTFAVNANSAGNGNLGGGAAAVGSAPIHKAADFAGGMSGGFVEFISGPLAGQRIPLTEGKQMTMGRAPTCSICLNGANNVSGNHCSIQLNGSMILVTDLGSTNGTFIGKQRLTPHQATLVPDGGTVLLGSQNCSFRVNIR